MAHDTQCEAELIHGAYTDCDCEARHVLALADALARAVDVYEKDVLVPASIKEAARRYTEARGSG